MWALASIVHMFSIQALFLDLAVQLLFVAGPALLCSVQHEDLDLDWMSYRMALALPRMRGCMYLTN